MIAVLNGSLGVPKWMSLLNSIVFLIIGVLFRKINSSKFQDLPGIIMSSVGLAMIGIIGIVSYFNIKNIFLEMIILIQFKTKF